MVQKEQKVMAEIKKTHNALCEEAWLNAIISLSDFRANVQGSHLDRVRLYCREIASELLKRAMLLRLMKRL